jgi:P2 family phage contractile tail tube protein
VETPAGFEAMEAELKWTSFYADTMREVGDPTKALQMSLRGSIEKFESSGRTSQEAYVVYLTGMPKSFPTGTFVAHDNATFSSKFSINAIKIEVAGAVVLEFDAFANIYKVNGVDVYATYNQNIGA